MSLDIDYEIHEPTYEWSARLFTVLKKVVSVNMKLHQDAEQIHDGDIFLFNHFARFETFIPQYFVHQFTGAYCRSIASPEFFAEDDAFATYLGRVGAVPSDLTGLLPYLAGDILRGRKVIIFPEGGMVKDKRVVGPAGSYSVYSRTAEARRKHHSGAAVIALALDVFKQLVLEVHARGDEVRLRIWAQQLRMADVEQLLAAAVKPTRIVPANITFYPIRVNDNLLRRGAELLSRGLSRRMSEELLIEGNILLKDTDMDIRLGQPIRLERQWRWFDRKLIKSCLIGLDSIDAVFGLDSHRGPMRQRLLARRLRRKAQQIRDDYMHRMYTEVTLNLSHLASRLILSMVEAGIVEIGRRHFQEMLYVAVKRCQGDASLRLHRSLRQPRGYEGLLAGQCAGLEQLFRSASATGLTEYDADRFAVLAQARGGVGFRRDTPGKSHRGVRQRDGAAVWRTAGHFGDISNACA